MSGICPPLVVQLGHSIKSPGDALTPRDVTQRSDPLSTDDSTTTAYDSSLLPKTLRRFIVDPDTGCWEWTGPRKPEGYPVGVQYDLHRGPAHRLIFEFFNGPVPTDQHVHHRCNNKGCVNPAHLAALTRSEHRRTYDNLPPWTVQRLMTLVPEPGDEQ